MFVCAHYLDLPWGWLSGTTSFKKLPKSIKDRILDKLAIEQSGKDVAGNVRTQKGTKSGFAQVNLFDFPQLNYLYIDYIGYFGVKIPLSDLKGKSSTIEVLLKGQDDIDRNDE